MNKQWMTIYMANDPEDRKSSYIFLTDDKDLALCIAYCGFKAQALSEETADQGEYFSTDSLIDFLSSPEYSGTSRIAYTYVPACFHKWKNDRLETFFRQNGHLLYIPGWWLFSKKEYLHHPEYKEELTRLLDMFIFRQEGPGRVESSGGGNTSEHCPGNTWFLVNDSIRAQMHIFNKQDQPAGVLDSAVVDYIIAHVPLFINEMTVYLYQDGCYFPDRHGSHTREIIRSLLYPQMMKSNVITRIYQQLLDRVQLHKSGSQLNRQPRHWINFRNGYFDVKKWELIGHDPDYCTVNQIPYIIDPDWKPPDREYLTDCFLGEAVPDPEDRDMLWEFFGYAMTFDTGFQKFLILTGPGGTGKSVVIGMAEDLVGTENLSSISLQDLNNRFYPTALHLKLLNTCADISSVGMQNIDNLKKATGEDILIYERKGKDVSFFRSYAKLLFSANEIPLNLDDKSDAFYRRILILRMDHKADREKLDPDLREKMKAEWQYILFQALTGLRRLYEQQHFTQSSRCREAIRDLRRKADNVQAFVDECVRTAEGSRVKRSDLFEAYEVYCRENKRQSCGKGRFFERMDEHFPMKRNGVDGFCYQDIRLLSGEENILPQQENGFIPLEADEKTPFPTVK